MEKITDENEIKSMVQSRVDEIESRQRLKGDGGNRKPENSLTERYRRECTARAEFEAKELGHTEESKKPDIYSGFIRACFNCNELGDAICFNELNHGKFVFNALAGHWMVFEGHRWRVDTTNRTKEAVERVCEAYITEAQRIKAEMNQIEESGETAPANLKRLHRGLLARVKALRGMRRVHSVLEFSHSCDDPLCIQGDELDSDPWLLGCPNGVIELKTGRFRRGRQEDYISKTCGTPFEGYKASRPLWEETIRQIFIGDLEVIAFVQRFLGMALIGEIIEHKSLFWWGSGANGKSLLAETIRRVCGDYATSVQPDLFMQKKGYANASGIDPATMALRAVRVAFASESEEGARVAAAKFKQLTGGDTLVGRNPHDKFMTTFLPSHSLIFLTNDRPGAAGHDYAFWRRVYLLEFGARFVDHPNGAGEYQVNKQLFSELKREYPGILAWLVEGCLIYQQRGLDPPASIIAATDRYREDEDLIGLWVAECCVLNPQYRLGASDAYNSFVEWYHENVGSKEPSQKTFGAWMVKRFERSRSKPRQYYGLCTIV